MQSSRASHCAGLLIHLPLSARADPAAPRGQRPDRVDREIRRALIHALESQTAQRLRLSDSAIVAESAFGMGLPKREAASRAPEMRKGKLMGLKIKRAPAAISEVARAAQRGRPMMRGDARTRGSRRVVLGGLVALAACWATSAHAAASAAALNAEIDTALANLYSTEELGQDARGQGKGHHGVPGHPEGRPRGLGWRRRRGGVARRRKVGRLLHLDLAASIGIQAGAQAFSYALFLMNEEALNALHSSSGWEIGVGPTVVLVDAGLAKKLSTTTLQDDVYAYIFGQGGLMAGIGIEGSKITEFTPDP